jgi:transposase
VPRIDDTTWDALAVSLAGSTWRRTDRVRALAEAALWTLRSGQPWSALPSRFPPASACRRAWRAWLRDGRWVEFWSRYVVRLAARDRRAWERALMRGAETLRARESACVARTRAAWWLVSARILTDSLSVR